MNDLGNVTGINGIIYTNIKELDGAKCPITIDGKEIGIATMEYRDD